MDTMKDPTIKTIFITVMFWFAFVAACGFISSCNILKKKDRSKTIDQTETTSKVFKEIISSDTSNLSIDTDKKESGKKSVDNKVNETQKDLSTIITEKSKTTLFDSTGKIKSITESEKKTENLKKESNKKKDNKKLSDFEKLDKSKSKSNNGQIKNSIYDSLFTELKDVGIKTDNKETKHRTDPLPFAIVLIVISCGLIWWFRYK